MSQIPNSQPHDLEERTFTFAKTVRAFVRRLPRSICNVEDVRQLVQCSGSVGANYIEANEALSRKDFLVRMRTSRKEAKEFRFWLRLLDAGTDATVMTERDRLIAESTELLKILSAIINKSS
jgi:four helix bundle protein